jgi:drug/metabolite transporter (DMT)-like permease
MSTPLVPFPLPRSSAVRLRADLILLMAALVWGLGFVAQRLTAASLGVFLFNGIRFMLGALVLLPVARFKIHISRRNLPGVLLAGVLLFTGSALQQAGMRTTTAANAGFITGLYVVIVPLLVWLGWRERIGAWVWVAVGVAVGGTAMLSTGGSFKAAPGDALELAGAVVWAMHLIVVGRQSRRMDVFSFVFGQFVACGLLNLGAGLIFDLSTVPALPASLAVIAFSGIVSVGIGFTLQAVGQKHAPPTDAALILSLEAVFGALAGFIFLHEGLTLVQVIGCVLIFLAVVMAQIAPPPAPPVAPLPAPLVSRGE